MSVKRLALIAAMGLFLTAVPGQSFAQYCVRYARSLTDVEINGNAWSWWERAAGVYQRGGDPAVGAVLVFQRGYGGMRLGHVSAVTGIIDDRTILVTHSFGGPILWRDVPIVDTSPANDWTRVRVWHGPSRQMGTTDFATYGFVYPHGSGPAPDIAEPASVAATAADEPPVRATDPGDAARQFGIDWDWLSGVPLPASRPHASMVTAHARGLDEAGLRTTGHYPPEARVRPVERR